MMENGKKRAVSRCWCAIWAHVKQLSFRTGMELYHTGNATKHGATLPPEVSYC